MSSVLKKSKSELKGDLKKLTWCEDGRAPKDTAKLNITIDNKSTNKSITQLIKDGPRTSTMMNNFSFLRKDAEKPPKNDVDKKKEQLNPTNCVLEKEKISTEIYNFLWMKESRFLTSCIGLLLPETVIIKNGAITSWYMMINGTIVKKRKEKCTIENLKKSFLKNELKCGVIASFIKYKEIDKDLEYEMKFYDESEFGK